MRVRVAQVLDLVCSETGVSRDDLRSPSREQHVALARAFVYYLARKHSRMGWRAIARVTTGRDGKNAQAQVSLLLRALERDGALKAELHEIEAGLVRFAQGTQV